jgi:fermentation-respiration switch protein FrsA (DUF1100 family)
MSDLEFEVNGFNALAADVSTPVKTKLKNKKQLLSVVLVVSVVYLAVGIFLASPLYSMILLQPQSELLYHWSTFRNDKLLSKIREDHFFPAVDGQKLHGSLFRAPGSKNLVLIHHGTVGDMGRRHEIVRHCVSSGSSVFIYDYRGYGESGGKTGLEKLPQDGLAAYDFVTNTLKFRNIVNYGESTGSGVCMLVSKARPCDGIILQSAICSLPEAARDRFFLLRAYPDALFPFPHFSNVNLVGELRKPILIIHGLMDKEVPYEQGQKLYELANQPKTFLLLPASGHDDVGVYDEERYETHNPPDVEKYEKAMRNFLASVQGAEKRN